MQFYQISKTDTRSKLRFDFIKHPITTRNIGWEKLKSSVFQAGRLFLQVCLRQMLMDTSDVLSAYQTLTHILSQAGMIVHEDVCNLLRWLGAIFCVGIGFIQWIP